MPASCSCGRQWTGLSQAHCPTCHAHFGSVQGFDKHRATGRCVDPETVTDRNGRPWFKPVKSPFGPTWTRDDPRGHYRNAPSAGIATSGDTEDAA